ncbi:MAG: hypothetical protein JNM72_09315 [Deltaproteobacteria bacterium]|nr:hypothetical protein [Deltaproteobacteria bacterium]
MRAQASADQCSDGVPDVRVPDVRVPDVRVPDDGNAYWIVPVPLPNR